MEKILLLVALGLLIGFALKKRTRAVGVIATLVFAWILPILVVTEVSSMDIAEWPLFLWGSGFVLVFFYLGRALGLDKHRSALLATAEGGTMGFVLYNIIGTEPLSRFFLVDMLGNGGILFSFIYFQVGNEYKLKEFAKNPLMLAMFGGIVLNLIGWHIKDVRWIPADIPYLKQIATLWVSMAIPYLGQIVTLMISLVVGSAIELRLSGEILRSTFFWSFWAIRTAGAAMSVVLSLPLALVVLFVLPPSFLLPVIYREDEDGRAFASNMIASSLPISLVLAAILVAIVRNN